MNKKEIINAIQKKVSLPKKVVMEVMDSFRSVLLSCLKNGDKFKIVGLFTVFLVEKASREVRNPKTGKIMTTSAKKIPKFKASNDVKVAAASAKKILGNSDKKTKKKK